MKKLRIVSAILSLLVATNAAADPGQFDAVVIPHGTTIPRVTLPTNNWNTAYGWGNHATNGYATSNGAVAYASVAGSATNSQYASVANQTTNAQYASVAATATNAQYATTANTASNLNMASSIIPTQSNAFDVGSQSFPIRDLYLNTNSVYMGGQKVLSYNPTTSQLVTSVGMQLSAPVQQAVMAGELYAGEGTPLLPLYVTTTYNPQYLSGKYTLAAWVHPTNLIQDNYIISQQYSSGLGGKDDGMLLQADGSLRLRAGGGVFFSNSTNTITAGQWVHTLIAVDLDAGTPTVTLFLNGVKTVLTNATPATWGNPTYNIKLGDKSGGIGALPFYGKFDEMAMWSRALTDAEALELYNSYSKIATNRSFVCTGTPMSNNLEFIYYMDTGSGTVATDDSGNLRDGTMNRDTWGTGKNLSTGFITVTQAQNMAVGALSASGSVTPTASNQYSLGSQNMPFKDLFLDTNSVYMGGVKVLSYDPATTSLVSAVPIVQITTNNVTNATAMAVAAGSNAAVSASTNGSTVTYTVSAGDGYATNAGYASVAGSATNSTYAGVAGSATNASYASVAGSATNAQFATVAATATNLAQRGATNGQMLAWDAGTSLWVATNAPTSSPGGVGKYTVMLSTTNLNVLVGDVAKTFVMQPTADLTNFLPSVTFADVGTWYTFVKNGTNRLTIKAADADVIADSNPGARLYNSATNEYYATVTLQLCNGTNWVITGAHGTWTSTTD